MASPSKRFEDGVLVERAIETSHWRVAPDGSELAEKETVEAQQNRPYKKPVPTKMMTADTTENKAAKSSATKTTKASKKD